MRVALFCAVAIAISTAACSGGPNVFGDRDSGQEISVDAGDQFEIRLESNPSTGFVWTIAEGTDPRAVELRDQHHESAETDAVGAAGHDVFVFEAVGGAEVVRLEYVRPFDEPAIPERVAEFIVRVDGAAWPPATVEPPPTSTSTSTAPVEIAALLAADRPTDATVVGYVVWGPAGALLCEVLMESFPPQCGGAAVSIANPWDLIVEFETEQSIRWTDDRVSLTGRYDGARLTVAI